MNPDEIIESVARAMHGNRYSATTAILATLDAIRKPSDVIIKAGRNYPRMDPRYPVLFSDEWWVGVYDAMIYALKREIAK